MRRQLLVCQRLAREDLLPPEAMQTSQPENLIASQLLGGRVSLHVFTHCQTV